MKARLLLLIFNIFLIFFISFSQTSPIFQRSTDVCTKCKSYVPTSPLNSETAELRECLSYINGTIVYRNNDTYYESIKECNCRIMVYPLAIIYVNNTKDIQEVVNCGNLLNITVVVRSGGHSFENYSLGGKDGVLIIDLKNYNKITIDPIAQTAVVGAGNRIGPVYYTLNEAGFLFTAGSCPSVGVGGQTTGGGYGFIGPKYGMASDNILAAEVVLANGTILPVVDNSTHSDLYFAIRGAGNGGFGVITLITFQLYYIPPVMTWFNLSYDIAGRQNVFDAFNECGPKLAENYSLYMTFLPNTFDKNNSCQTKEDYTLWSFGTFLGEEIEARKGLKNFINHSAPIIEPYFNQTTWWETLVQFAAKEGSSDALTNPSFDPEPFKAKSFFVDPPGLSYEGLEVLYNFINSVKCKIVVMFELYGGGKVNNIKPDLTAFMHRHSLALLQLEMKLAGYDQEVVDECLAEFKVFGEEFQDKYTSYYSYQNYIDRELKDWQHRYYGNHFEKLVKIKAKYDPNNLFNWDQSIPTSY
ncbi:5722_t:CDS:2 [Diversispora eburnea]|uniref:5722_t:CDS:1 n=1 Tax=Diversispora eburnea TaxID=1213867 RepID=A0A9N9ANY9_9GLOM|nr:5722_t:CDS:2 [Diversispora eburnea]